MSMSSSQNPILLGLMGALAVMTLGVAVAMAFQLNEEQGPVPSGLSQQIGLISGECANQLLHITSPSRAGNAASFKK